MLIESNTFLFLITLGVVSTIFAVLIYWCLRICIPKINILPWHHIRHISYLVFVPVVTFGAIFLHLDFVLFLISTLTVLISLIVFELFFRNILSASGVGISPSRISQGRNGVQVPYKEAREASGDYPYFYLTEEFFASIQYGTMYDRAPSSKKSVEEGIHYDRAFDYEGVGISVRNGLRSTTDQPVEFEKSVIFFGGSTTFGGREVPDSLTFSSFVQRAMNSRQKKVIVVNHGQGGATVVDRVEWLIEATPVNSGDVVCFYFGANDCGWVINYRGKLRYQIEFQSPLLQLLRRGPLLRSVLIQWLYGEVALRHNKWCAKKAFKDTTFALTRAKEWAEARGCKFLAVLQPQLYASETNLTYEINLRPRFSSFLVAQLAFAYPLYEKFLKTCGFGVTMTEIFDNLEKVVYLDWAHVNARGNEIIARHLVDVIDEYGWV